MKHKKILLVLSLLLASFLTINPVHAIENASDWFESSDDYVYYVGDIPSEVDEVVNIAFDFTAFDYEVKIGQNYYPIENTTQGIKLIQEIDASFNVTYSLVLFPQGTYIKTASQNTPETWGSLSIRREVQDFAPAIGGETVLANVDDPYSIEEIKDISGITAIDEVDGDLTSDIYVVNDNYTSNSDTLGTYTITFGVMDSKGNENQASINIVVRDLTAPQITYNGPAVFEASYDSPEMTQAQWDSFIDTFFEATDNYDVAPTFTIDYSDYVYHVVGIYDIVVTATDASGNASNMTVQFSLIDEVDPVFSGDANVTVSYTQHLQESDFLIGLSASDEIDGDLTSDIEIVSHDFVNGTPGTYSVQYQVSDLNGNVTTFTRTYTSVDDEIPVFYFTNEILYIEDVNMMSNEQFANFMADMYNIELASYTIDENTYLGHEEIPGSYVITLSMTSTSGEVTQVTQNIEVFNLEELRPAEPTLFVKIWTGFINVLTAIWTWVVDAWLWTKDLFITLYQFIADLIAKIFYVNLS